MNSDIEPGREDQPQAASPPTTSDPWQIWFSRLIQVTGLGIMVFETLGRKAERPWLMLFATGMMLGGIGLQLILRWVAARVPQ
jgi:hypothetical protein